MPYFNKYTLDFGDVEGHDYRLLIQEKDYSGSVTTPKFGGSPITIRYDGDDNHYGAIYGSSATIQIYEETANQFDDLIFTEDKNHRVVLKYLDPATSNYLNYWIGFIVADRMTRTIQQLPNLLSFRAFDGLGLLEQEDLHLPSRTSATSLNRMIFNILKKLNINDDTAGLTIYHATTIFKADTLYSSSSVSGVLTSNRLLTLLRATSYPTLTSELGITNAKKQLINLLKAIGSRIYQAQGYWWIDQNAGLMDDDILQDAIQNAFATNSGTGLTNLGTRIKNRLQGTLEYNVRTWRYSQTTGNYFQNGLESRLKIVPYDAKALELKESFEPVIGQIDNAVDIKTFKRHQMFTNSGFEYDNPNVTNINTQQINNQGWNYRQQGGNPGQFGNNIYGATTLGFPQTPPYRSPIQEFRKNKRKNGRFSFFTNIMQPQTMLRFTQTENTSYLDNWIFKSELGGNRFKITGFYDKKLKISISLFTEFNPIPEDFSQISGANFWQCQYRLYLYEYNSNGVLNNNPIYMWRRSNTASSSRSINFELEEEDRADQWTEITSNNVYPRPDIFKIEKVDYNRWVTFTAEIASPFEENSNRADEEFVLSFELIPPYLFNGGSTGTNGFASTPEAEVFAQNGTFMSMYKGFYADNLQIFFEEKIDSPKTFESILSIDTAGNINKLSKNIKLKTRGTGNFNNDDIATIDNFGNAVFQRPQSVTGTQSDKVEADGGLPQAKELPYLVNQDLANDYRARLKTYEGKLKVMDPNTKPIFFSDRLYFAWGVNRPDLFSQQGADFSQVDDENVVTINKMTFNPKKNTYTIKGSLSDQKENSVNTFGDIDLLERIKIDTDEGDS